ncbi:hypothetical protein MB02_10475 [Croceicoccus estronivorus]|uniref:hypothetical protein n=1 Tax=Croceicoccus estronivorus TaxID=1172626 RepID=UPI00082A2298|nr:hypothetical protein [Croceicoccus estronivorus]OCC23590.1 hypothetical protein MB02_10475 [Croceicoccus estronivorus]
MNGAMRTLGILLVACTCLVTGCAAHPTVHAFAVPPGIAEGAAKTFATIPPEDEGSQAAMPFVEQRLLELGYSRDTSPEFLVQVTATRRPQRTGAFIPGPDAPVTWAEKPRKTWLAPGRNVMALRIHLLDAHTGAPVYVTTAELSSAKASFAEVASPLARAALDEEPQAASFAVQTTP